MMRRTVAISALLFTGVVMAQPEAIRAITAGDDVLKRDQPLVVRFTIEELYLPSAPELNRIRETVKTFPEHPDGRWLEVEKRRLNGPEVMECATFVGQGSLRANRNGGALPMDYMDTVIDGDTSWILLPETLRVVDQSHPPENPGYAYWTTKTQRMDELSLFLTGGLGSVAAVVGAIESENRTDEVWSWKAVHAQNPDVRILASGKFFNGAPVASRVDVLVASTGTIDSSWISSEWRFDPILNRPMAQSIVLDIPAAKITRRFRLQSVEQVSVSEFREMLKPPPPDGSDPIRGKLVVTGFEDLRPGREVVGVREGTGFTQAPSPTAIANSGRPPLRVVGWVTAGVLAAVVVAIRLRKARKA